MPERYDNMTKSAEPRDKGSPSLKGSEKKFTPLSNGGHLLGFLKTFLTGKMAFCRGRKGELS